MDLEISEEQKLLREMSARFIESRCPLAAVRAFGDDERGVSTDYMKQTAELGWYALLVDESLGGGQVSESGISDAAIVAEERGRLLQPGPFVPANLVALALSKFGSEEQRSEILPGIVAGERVATWAVADATGTWDPGSGVVASTRADGLVLDGTKAMVQDAHLAETLLVTAQGETGSIHVLVPANAPGVAIQPLSSLDITRRFSRVHFDSVEVPARSIVGTPQDSDSLYDRLLDVAAVLTAAESVGAMGRLFDITVEYSKDRWAFGRPIGSFQAIKHTLADTGLLLEMSRAISAAATRAVASSVHEAAEVASMAKAFVGKHSIEVSHSCFQVFAGIAYTWEHDFHLYYRRLATDAALYGEPIWHRERICRIHGL
jgi:alkylation response protein AidB-like acyl-CoA dehydrogenase